MKIKKIFEIGSKYLTDKDYRFLVNNRHGLNNRMDDKTFIEHMFHAKLKQDIDFNHPITFNQKLQWLKLYDRKPIYTKMVDKIEAKKLVASKIGSEYIIPTLGVWDNPDDIDFDLLPEKFVLKCNHNSGNGMYICKDKSKINPNEIREKLREGLNEDYYITNREWPYKNVKRRILAEQYMEDFSTHELRDYKFFCFNGQAKCYKVDFDRFSEHHANYYDADNNLLKFGEAVCLPKFDKNIQIPSTIFKMKELAEELSEEVPFLRADFYDVNGKIYFGELTFYPAAGFGKMIPEEWDEKIGQWLILPDENLTGGKRNITISEQRY